MIDMAHFAGLVAGGVHPSPVPHADVVTTTTHKTLRGPRAGMILCKAELAASIDRSVFPGQQGGPLVHVIAGKAVAFKEALQPEFKAYARADGGECEGAGGGDAGGGVSRDFWRYGYAFDFGGCVCRRGCLGRRRRVRWGQAGITVNKNAIPYRYESADEA